MAYILEKIGNTYNLPKRYFTCDAKSDLDRISLVDAPTGSEAYCILEEETYILDSNKQWHKKKINEDLIEQVQVKLENKQDKLTFDSIPTKGSMNPVTSDGIKRYVDSNGGSGGSSGSSGDFMDKSVYDPNGKATDIFKYVDDARALYIDLSDGVSHTNAYDEIKTAYDAGRPIIAVYSGSHNVVDDITVTYEHQHVPLMSINDEYASFIVNDLPHRLVILAFADGSVSARVDMLSHMNSSFLNLGENITKVSDNDTVAFWAAKESGQAWFSANNMLVNQPNQYGFVISYVHDTNVFQIFSDQTNGVTYFRYGDNVNNWFKNWSLIPTVNARGELIIDGNIKGAYTIGEWLQTTTTENHQIDAAEKIAVLDGNGLVYYRTPAEILRDVGAMPNISVTASDNGKFLRVVNGAWAAVSISNAEEASF